MDLFELSHTTNPQRPLADRVRPHGLEDLVGQTAILGDDKLLRKAIESDKLFSMLFWGPPGSGKTTLVSLLAADTALLEGIEFAILEAVLVITLVQQNALSTIGEGRTAVLFIDGDQGRLGSLIHTALEEAPGVDLTVVPDGEEEALAEALARVTKGEFQLYLRLPPGTTARVPTRAKVLARQALGEADGAVEPPPANVELYFDPTVLGSLRSAVHHLLALMLLRVEVDEKVAALGERLPEAMAADRLVGGQRGIRLGAFDINPADGIHHSQPVARPASRCHRRRALVRA